MKEQINKQKNVTRDSFKNACQIRKKLKNKCKSTLAFTLIEILVTIVIIGLLATITSVVYVSVLSKTTEASQASDLESAKNDLSKFHGVNGEYPATVDCSIPDSGTNLCLKSDHGTTFTYSTTGDTYTLDVVK